MSPRAKPAIIFHDLTLGYDWHPAVHHINGEVKQGELLAIVGPNGAGKSTLLKGIIGELKPLGGSVDRDGLTKADIAYLPQQIDIDRSFPISVFDCVAMGLWREIGAWRGLDVTALQAVDRRACDGRAAGSLRPSGRRALGRSVPARPVRAAAFAGRFADPARRAIPRRRCQDHRSPHHAHSSLARRRAHRLAALHDIEQVRAHFPRRS